MKAVILTKTSRIEDNHMQIKELPFPEPQDSQILIQVLACGVCHTDLDEIEGRLPPPKLPIILGHQIVGRVAKIGPKAGLYKKGDRVGVGWINWACGTCQFCMTGRENLCADFRGTGWHAHGGYAEYTVVDEQFAYPIPAVFTDSQAAPLLCAGAIGYRAVKLTGLRDGQTLGLFGFGASAHIAIQIVRRRYPKSRVFVFSRPGQTDHQALARKLGADWVGATGQDPPQPLHAAIDFTPVWQPVVEAMRVLEKGGRLVINAIRKENRDKESLLHLDYARHLWQEKELKTTANITRADLKEFLPLAAEIPIAPEIREFPLEQANQALTLLKQGKLPAAAVLKIAE
jgi:alcohol dehydrogenase, propanol-preferring